MILNVAVCDDNVTILKDEIAAIKKQLERKQIIYNLDAFSNPKELLTTNSRYDMLFLDVELGEMNGIEVAQKIAQKKKDSLFFFITDYMVYLDKAFDINTIRYFCKPIDEKRLSDGIDRAIMIIEDRDKKIKARHIEKKVDVYVEVSDIIYITTSGRHTLFVTTKYGEFEAKEVFSVMKKRIEEEVDYFVMPHQSFYINLNYVVDYTKEYVTMNYEGRRYTAHMTRRKYKNFVEKFFMEASKLR